MGAPQLGHRNPAAQRTPSPAEITAKINLARKLGLAEFQALRPAEETEAVPDLDPTGHAHPGVQKQQLRMGMGIVWAVRDSDEPKAPPEVTVDSVPFGEVEVHGELTVCATDGDIGQVQGLVVEPGGHQVTHVLLQEGHMRGRKEVAIPIGAVTKIGTLLILSLIHI